MMPKLELDWAHEGDIAIEAKRLAAFLDIDVEVVTESGPGGGWPILRFTAEEHVLRGILLGYDDTLSPDDVITWPHTVNGKSDGPWPYGTTHDARCPACVKSGTSFTASPRSENYWSS